MTNLFRDKTVLITGASSGFGAAFARIFASEGARLINVARRKERLQELENELSSKYKTEILSIDLDVADNELVIKKLANLPEKFAIPDILINNAGMVRGMNKVWDTPPQDWDEMIDTNIKGVLNFCAQIIPRMLKANRGHIINVGSVSSHDTYPGGGVYCATKYAVRAITDTLRKELVATPLRVSMISPGMAKTEFSEVRFSGNKEKADSVYENFKALSPEDVAEMVLFIASRPAHVDIADLIVFPTHQASVSLLHRGGPSTS
jgi:3-hydroxy acid dehydrogenase / malonic semialdehyde reductase